MKKFLISLTFALISKIALSTIVPVVNSGFTFSLATITVNVGDTISFSLASAHNIAEVSQVTFTANGNTQLPGGFSAPFGGGLVFTAALTTGTHWYVCQPHAAMGMKGKIIVQSATGIADNLLQANFSVYPNPTTSKATINFYQVVRGTLQLSNASGEVLEQRQFNSSGLTLDVGTKPNGVYFITVADVAGNRVVRTLVKTITEIINERKVPFQSNAMKTISLFLITYIISANVFSQASDWLWADGLSGKGDDAGLSVICDSLGNIYTAGSFQETVDFDPGAGIFNLNSTGGDDIFISKLDSAGNYVWAKKIGGTGFDCCHAIAIDASQNIYLTGEFTGTVDFDAGAGTFNLAGGGHFISKLNSSGNFVWAKAVAGAGGYSIGLDVFANVYTTGYFSGTTDFNPGAGAFILSPQGGTDHFILKLDSSGNFAWAKKVGGSGNDVGWSIALDHKGKDEVYTTGVFMDTVDFDPGTGIFNLISDGNSSIFICKLNSVGDFIWAKAIGGVSANFSGGLSIAVSATGSGSVYTTGFFSGTNDFDPGPGTFNVTALGSNDIFVSKLDSTGNFVWAKKMGGVNNDVGLSLALDASENIYTSGFFEGTGDFNPDAGFNNLTSAGNHDIFVSKLDSSGNFVWANGTGGLFDDDGRSIALDAYGNVILAGDFYSSLVYFDSTFLLNGAAGSSEIFIASLRAVIITGNKESENFGNGILLFPNPANSEVTLIFGKEVHGTLLLSTMLGEVLDEVQINTTRQSVTMSNRPKGIYFITVIDAAGNREVRKIVKM